MSHCIDGRDDAVSAAGVAADAASGARSVVAADVPYGACNGFASVVRQNPDRRRRCGRLAALKGQIMDCQRR